jgi:GntR family transcriptional regulator
MRLKPNIPMAIQASNVLRQQLRKKRFPDNRLPSEHTIAADLGISRGTVRQALAILEQEGIIIRHQGSGTFVNPHVLQIDARVDVAYEFSELIEAAGFTPTIDTVEVKRLPADAEVAQQLAVAVGAPLLVIHKVFLASGQPTIFVMERIPVALIREAYDDNELHNPIFTFLQERCQVEVDYILSAIIPSLVEGDLVARLGVAAGQTCLQFNEVFYSPSNQPLAQATVFFRDPIIRFHALRKMSQMR